MPEEDSFCVFVQLMEDYGVRELYKPNMSELGLCIYQLENLVQVRLVNMHGIIFSVTDKKMTHILIFM